MRNLKRVMALLITVSVLGTFFIACGEKAEPATTAVTAPMETTANQGKMDYLKMDKPVTITTALRTIPEDKFPIDGTSLWGKKYAEYGINIKILWTTDAAQYDTKLNTVIAAGDIPDVLMVSQPMGPLVKGVLIADLTKALDTYLLPNVKEDMFGKLGKEAMDAVTIDGKIRFIPTNISENRVNAFPLFIRQDWLKNLNLEIPKNIDDFKKIAEAFAKNDPDKNGKNDTYGIGIIGQTNLVEDWGGLYGYFPAFGVQPCTWYDGMLFYSKDSSGKAVWDGTQPAVKEGLQILVDLYKSGAIAQDFATMDSNAVTTDLNCGKAGMVFGARGLPFWAINNTIKEDPKAEWYAMNMPTKDGKASVQFGWQPVDTAYAVSAKCPSLEAIVKAMNIAYTFGDVRSDKYVPELRDEQKVRAVAGNPLISPYYSASERDKWTNFLDGVAAKDTSKLTAANKVDYQNMQKYIETKDPSCWPIWNAGRTEKGAVMNLIWKENTDSMIKKNLYWSMPTDNMASKLPLFKKMEEEAIVKIITGNAPITEWDSMVEKWNKIGGDSITKDVNDYINK